MSIQDGIPVPKYYRLKESIRDMIEEQQLGEGHRIPSERELCERYGVSRMTARQAVKDLVNEGILYREQGRGTFVAGEKIRHETARLTSFTQDMHERGMEVSSTTLEAGIQDASPVVARMLKIDAGEPIVRIKRIRNADGQPMALETSHLRHGAANSLLEVDLSRSSLYEELRKLGINIVGADQRYEATLVRADEARHLGVSPGSPALLVERVTFDNIGKPSEYVKSLYRGDRYHVATTLRS